MQRATAVIVVNSVVWALIGLAAGHYFFGNSREFQSAQPTLLQQREPESVPLRTLPGSVRQAIPMGQTTSAISVRISVPADEALAAAKQRAMERQAAAVSNYVARVGAERSEEYSRLFQSFGLSTSQAEAAKAGLEAINRAARSASQQVGELNRERIRFANQLKAQMSEEAYGAYRAFEESRSAANEMSMLDEYSRNQRGQTLESSVRELVASLILETKAYTSKSFDGPFDGIPEVWTGDEMIIPNLRRWIDDQVDQANGVLRQAIASGVSTNDAQLVADYFTSRISAWRAQLDHLLTTTPEQRTEATRQEAQRFSDLVAEGRTKGVPNPVTYAQEKLRLDPPQLSK